MNILYDVPGGDDFVDVSDLFDDAANELEEGEFVVSDGFTLMDAMSAFEIGEPRMDSGMILETERTHRFNPLSPLLPQELCWIIDRSFTYEFTDALACRKHTITDRLHLGPRSPR